MKLSIHPLFYITLILSAVFGGLPTVLICLVTALLHESGHVFCAASMGYECRQIKIMPYGAAAVCDIEGISVKDEVRLALAGPLVNAAICIATVAIWWFWPEAYAYTDTVFEANLSMLIVNMLPAYPLDGGRILGCLIKNRIGDKKAEYVLKISAVFCSVGMFALYFTVAKNPSLILFGGFLLLSAKEKAPKMGLIDFSFGVKVKRPKEIKAVLCPVGLTFLQSFKLLERGRYVVLRFIGEGGKEANIGQNELYSLALTHGIYEEVLSCYLAKNSRENLSESGSEEDISSMQPKASLAASSNSPSKEE